MKFNHNKTFYLVGIIFVLLLMYPLSTSHSLQIENNSNDLRLSSPHDELDPCVVPIVLIVTMQSQSNDITIANGKVKDQSDQQTNQISKLTGKTRDIYCLLMDNQTSFGVREIQRHFGYSSPNLAAYHLDKLLHLNLVQKTDDNQYNINPMAKPLEPYDKKLQIFGQWIHQDTILGVLQILIALIGLILIILGLTSKFWKFLYFSVQILGGIYLIKNRK